jgi:hypothetical protein
MRRMMDIKKIMNRKIHLNQIPKTTSLSKPKSNKRKNLKKLMKTMDIRIMYFVAKTTSQTSSSTLET